MYPVRWAPAWREMHLRASLVDVARECFVTASRRCLHQANGFTPNAAADPVVATTVYSRLELHCDCIVLVLQSDGFVRPNLSLTHPCCCTGGGGCGSGADGAHVSNNPEPATYWRVGVIGGWASTSNPDTSSCWCVRRCWNAPPVCCQGCHKHIVRRMDCHAGPCPPIPHTYVSSCLYGSYNLRVPVLPCTSMLHSCTTQLLSKGVWDGLINENLGRSWPLDASVPLLSHHSLCICPATVETGSKLLECIRGEVQQDAGGQDEYELSLHRGLVEPHGIVDPPEVRDSSVIPAKLTMDNHIGSYHHRHCAVHVVKGSRPCSAPASPQRTTLGKAKNEGVTPSGSHSLHHLSRKQRARAVRASSFHFLSTQEAFRQQPNLHGFGLDFSVSPFHACNAFIY